MFKKCQFYKSCCFFIARNISFFYDFRIRLWMLNFSASFPNFFYHINCLMFLAMIIPYKPTLSSFFKAQFIPIDWSSSDRRLLHMQMFMFPPQFSNYSVTNTHSLALKMKQHIWLIINQISVPYHIAKGNKNGSDHKGWMHLS